MDWDPAEHPRAPAGAPASAGGQFITREPAFSGLRVNQVTSGFVSRHVGASRSYNENNYGVGITLRNGAFVGAYKNSVNKTSVYAGYEAKARLTQNIEAGALLGVVSGYKTKRNKEGILPLILPELIVSDESGKHSVAFVVVPPVKREDGQRIPPTVAAQYRFRF